MSTPKNSSTKPSSPSAQDIDSILQLFKYRNIAWRYLLCYCLPLQQKILIKQLRIAHHKKSSLDAQRRESLQQKKSSKPSILINLATLFDVDQHDLDDNDDDDDDIPDFYHLPRISLKELQTLFDEGRKRYEVLKKVYITDKQQNIRNDTQRATAPPSEQCNDPSLRTRSDTITALLEHEDKNSNKIFSRIDLIDSDWKSQESMNKLKPPTYSPPKPPPPLPPFKAFIDSTRKNTRSRFNTFTRTGDKLSRKKKKTGVFQSEEMVKINPFSALSKTGEKKKNKKHPPKTPRAPAALRSKSAYSDSGDNDSGLKSLNRQRSLSQDDIKYNEEYITYESLLKQKQKNVFEEGAILSTKDGLFSDEEDYINVKCEDYINEESFGEIVLMHPLNMNVDKEDKEDKEDKDDDDDFTVHEIEENENKELWKQIMKDVNRTFQYRDFFRKKETRHSLGNLLYIWSRINDKIGYLQGMHDLASIITCAIYFDYKIFNDDDDDNKISELEQLLDPKYLEHDIYAIYDALLQLTVKLFEAAVPPSQSQDNEFEAKEESESQSHQNRGLFVSTSNCSLYLKLHYLHHKLLKHFDLQLYTHFEDIGLSPQLYMLRWIRVLFSREFYLDQIITLWDELFVSENLIVFIDYIVMAMIHNVRKELLQKKDMTIIQLLQNYPKHKINIASLAVTARQIQKGEIKFDLVTADNEEFYSHIKSVDKMKDYWQEAMYLLKEVKDYTTFPTSSINTSSLSDYSYCKGPDIRIPGFAITQTQKYFVKQIILKSYGTQIPQNDYIRMGYLVKRGSGDQSFFSRKNLKIRWFVIDKQKKFSYFKNRKSFNKNEEALRTPIALKGRAIRVVEAKYFCFEISGISNISKRAYLLFAKDFTDFVLWLHALMWCADKSLYEGM